MRLIFWEQASKTKQHQSKSNLYFGLWCARATQLATLSLILIGFCFSVPQTTQAKTARIDDITIDRQPDETYDSLIQRAESAARNAVEQSFNQGSQITNVSVVILGQNQGIIAPVLSIGVSRPQWSSGGNEFIYFNSARSLLRLDEQQLATTNSPQQQKNTPPVPRTSPQTNPRTPGSSREIINNAPIQPVNPTPAASPLPGSPALVPRPQAPGITPITSPGDNQNSGNNLTTPPPSVAPVTFPTPGNASQVNPANTSPDRR